MRTPRRRYWWFPPSQRAERDEQIKEQFALGRHYDQIADEFGLTKQRVWQIVNGYRKG